MAKKQLLNLGIPKTASVYISKVFDIPHRHYTFTDYGDVNGWIKPPDYDFLFAIVRNPYDLLVSNYEFLRLEPLWNYDKKRLDSFENYIEDCINTPPDGVWANSGRLFRQLDGCRPDYIGTFETLDDDLQEIAKLVGSLYNKKPKANTSKRVRWQLYYNQRLKDQVYNTYKQDFIEFGYER